MVVKIIGMAYVYVTFFERLLHFVVDNTKIKVPNEPIENPHNRYLRASNLFLSL